MANEIHGALVHQRQYGFLTPDDQNRVTRLLIPNLFECFALSIHDAPRRVGMAVHVDGPPGFAEMIETTVPQLMRLGGRTFRIRTVNLNGATPQTAADAGLTVSLDDAGRAVRRQLIDIVGEFLSENHLLNISDLTPGVDLGSYPHAYLDAEGGMQFIDGRMHLTFRQLRQVQAEKLKYHSQLTRTQQMPPFTPSYLPKR